ncbi:hypothetical protein A9Q84_16335 [Halobacteriovorax marinus]|uniref:Secreted protein n=1 Tax=Halobacteriovorax marinus TaxID=97084 RepID=A0A1Y5F887_9BACT|nr:hypothetical protein A9Q84_16335 [Halobacteriovorax marinus]
MRKLLLLILISFFTVSTLASTTTKLATIEITTWIKKFGKINFNVVTNDQGDMERIEFSGKLMYPIGKISQSIDASRFVGGKSMKFFVKGYNTPSIILDPEVDFTKSRGGDAYLKWLKKDGTWGSAHVSIWKNTAGEFKVWNEDKSGSPIINTIKAQMSASSWNKVVKVEFK